MTEDFKSNNNVLIINAFINLLNSVNLKLKGLCPSRIRHLKLIAGLFFKFTHVKMKGPNKQLKQKKWSDFFGYKKKILFQVNPAFMTK